MVDTKLTKEQNNLVRRELSELLSRYGTMAELASVLRVSQALISQVLGKKAGAGWKLLVAIARTTGKSTDAIIGKEAPGLDSDVQNLRIENKDLARNVETLVGFLDELVALEQKRADVLSRYQTFAKGNL